MFSNAASSPSQEVLEAALWKDLQAQNVCWRHFHHCLSKIAQFFQSMWDPSVSA